MNAELRATLDSLCKTLDEVRDECIPFKGLFRTLINIVLEQDEEIKRLQRAIQEHYGVPTYLRKFK